MSEPSYRPSYRQSAEESDIIYRSTSDEEVPDADADLMRADEDPLPDAETPDDLPRLPE